MPPTPSPLTPEHPQPERESLQPQGNSLQPEHAAAELAGSVDSDPDAPLSFVPHDATGALPQRPARIRAGRFGNLEEHELLSLLDSIEDERARGRFRESVYLSLFIWFLIAWVVLYGPRYLWHAPQLISPTDVLKQRELTQLNSPILSPSLHPPAPRARPTVDNKTLERLRKEAPAQPRAERTPQPPAPATKALPSNPAPQVPAPDSPTPVARRPTPPVADAPAPQTPTKPNFGTPGTAGDSIQHAIQETARNHGGGGIPTGRGGSGSSPLNTGVDILSDTQGVNFQPYLQRLLRQIYEQWIPLIPEEARPPLSKSGTTLVRFTILPDGTIGGMHLDGSSHDDALNRAAWGSITGVGQFAPLPPQFHGPNLELRIHYLVNKQTE